MLSPRFQIREFSVVGAVILLGIALFVLSSSLSSSPGGRFTEPSQMPAEFAQLSSELQEKCARPDVTCGVAKTKAEFVAGLSEFLQTKPGNSLQVSTVPPELFSSSFPAGLAGFTITATSTTAPPVTGALVAKPSLQEAALTENPQPTSNELPFTGFISYKPKIVPLSITTTPGASISADGAAAGTADGAGKKTVYLTEGAHKIRLTKTDYADSPELSVTIKTSGTNSLTHTLTPTKGSISITSSESGAKAYLARWGNDVISYELKGTTTSEPFVISSLNPGDYAVKLTKPSFVDFNKPSRQDNIPVRVTVGSTTPLSVTLQLKPLEDTALRITSNPDNARIYIDGVAGELTPKTVTIGNVDQHTVRVQRSNHFDKTQTVTPVRGETTPVSFTLNKCPDIKQQKGGLKVTVSPAGASGATVYVDGESKGTASPSKTVPNLQVCSHTVKVTKTGYADFVERKNTRNGQTVNVPVTLQPLPVTLTVSSTPSGATVFVDNENKGTAGAEPLSVTVPAGSHSYSLDLGGDCKPITGTVDVQAGASMPVAGTFFTTSAPDVWSAATTFADLPDSFPVTCDNFRQPLEKAAELLFASLPAGQPVFFVQEPTADGMKVTVAADSREACTPFFGSSEASGALPCRRTVSLRGDFDGDGIVGRKDVKILEKYVRGEDYDILLDLDGDGELTTVDVQQLQALGGVPVSGAIIAKSSPSDLLTGAVVANGRVVYSCTGKISGSATDPNEPFVLKITPTGGATCLVLSLRAGQGCLGYHELRERSIAVYPNVIYLGQRSRYSKTEIFDGIIVNTDPSFTETAALSSDKPIYLHYAGKAVKVTDPLSLSLPPRQGGGFIYEMYAPPISFDDGTDFSQCSLGAPVPTPTYSPTPTTSPTVSPSPTIIPPAPTPIPTEEPECTDEDDDSFKVGSQCGPADCSDEPRNDPGFCSAVVCCRNWKTNSFVWGVKTGNICDNNPDKRALFGEDKCLQTGKKPAGTTICNSPLYAACSFCTYPVQDGDNRPTACGTDNLCSGTVWNGKPDGTSCAADEQCVLYGSAVVATTEAGPNDFPTADICALKPGAAEQGKDATCGLARETGSSVFTNNLFSCLQPDTEDDTITSRFGELPFNNFIKRTYADPDGQTTQNPCRDAALRLGGDKTITWQTACVPKDKCTDGVDNDGPEDINGIYRKFSPADDSTLRTGLELIQRNPSSSVCGKTATVGKEVRTRLADADSPLCQARGWDDDGDNYAGTQKGYCDLLHKTAVIPGGFYDVTAAELFGRLKVSTIPQAVRQQCLGDYSFCLSERKCFPFAAPTLFPDCDNSPVDDAVQDFNHNNIPDYAGVTLGPTPAPLPNLVRVRILDPAKYAKVATPGGTSVAEDYVDLGARFVHPFAPLSPFQSAGEVSFCGTADLADLNCNKNFKDGYDLSFSSGSTPFDDDTMTGSEAYSGDVSLFPDKNKDLLCMPPASEHWQTIKFTGIGAALVAPLAVGYIGIPFLLSAYPALTVPVVGVTSAAGLIVLPGLFYHFNEVGPACVQAISDYSTDPNAEWCPSTTKPECDKSFLITQKCGDAAITAVFSIGGGRGLAKLGLFGAQSFARSPYAKSFVASYAEKLVAPESFREITGAQFSQPYTIRVSPTEVFVVPANIPLSIRGGEFKGDWLTRLFLYLNPTSGVASITVGGESAALVGFNGGGGQTIKLVPLITNPVVVSETALIPSLASALQNAPAPVVAGTLAGASGFPAIYKSLKSGSIPPIDKLITAGVPTETAEAFVGCFEQNAQTVLESCPLLVSSPLPSPRNDLAALHILQTDQIVAVKKSELSRGSVYEVTFASGIKGIYRTDDLGGATEVSVFRLSEALGIHSVPPTIIRRISSAEIQNFQLSDNERAVLTDVDGSMQLFIEGPEDPDIWSTNEARPTKMLDYLAGNNDRFVFPLGGGKSIARNFKSNLDGKMVAFDNERAFSTYWEGEQWLPTKDQLPINNEMVERLRVFDTDAFVMNEMVPLFSGFADKGQGKFFDKVIEMMNVRKERLLESIQNCRGFHVPQPPDVCPLFVSDSPAPLADAVSCGVDCVYGRNPAAVIYPDGSTKLMSARKFSAKFETNPSLRLADGSGQPLDVIAVRESVYSGDVYRITMEDIRDAETGIIAIGQTITITAGQPVQLADGKLYPPSVLQPGTEVPTFGGPLKITTIEKHFVRGMKVVDIETSKPFSLVGGTPLLQSLPSTSSKAGVEAGPEASLPEECARPTTTAKEYLDANRIPVDQETLISIAVADRFSLREAETFSGTKKIVNTQVQIASIEVDDGTLVDITDIPKILDASIARTVLTALWERNLNTGGVWVIGLKSLLFDILSQQEEYLNGKNLPSNLRYTVGGTDAIVVRGEPDPNSFVAGKISVKYLGAPEVSFYADDRTRFIAKHGPDGPLTDDGKRNDRFSLRDITNFHAEAIAKAAFAPPGTVAVTSAGKNIDTGEQVNMEWVVETDKITKKRTIKLFHFKRAE